MAFRKGFRELVEVNPITNNAILFDGKFYMVVAGYEEYANGYYNFTTFDYNARSLEEAQKRLCTLDRKVN